MAEILGERGDESQRQKAAERFRDRVLKSKSDFSNDQLRVMLKSQGDLWKEGVSVAEMFARQRSLSTAVLEASVSAEDDSAEDAAESDAPEPKELGQEEIESTILDYGGGKWGRYLRAPDFYFEIMRELGHRFAPFADVASIKRGITSGCDAFFMPHDVSKGMLEEYPDELAWRSLTLIPHCKRSEVQSGKVAIIECGDKTLHPIEREFIRPEIHSLTQVDRPIVTAKDTDRVVLWVGQELPEIRGTYAWQYISWGAKQTFASRSQKSKSVPVPERESCKGRNPWYDVTGLKPGIAFWPMTQKYRHIVPYNPDQLACNHRLFDVHATTLKDYEQKAFAAILNSTLVALIKHFFGRYAGSEGTLDTEVMDVLMLEIPDPKGANPELCNRLEKALKEICSRVTTHLVEQPFLDCTRLPEMQILQATPIGLPLELQKKDRRALDMLVFELLGVPDERQRTSLVDRLYFETASYNRQLRIQDIQSTINRAKSGSNQSISQLDLAADAWNEVDPEWQQPLRDWLVKHGNGSKTISLPEGRVRLPAAEHFFEATTLYFGTHPAVSYVCANREEADLLNAIAETGLRGPVSIPQNEEGCTALTKLLESRLIAAREKFDDLAAQRAGTDRLRDQVAQLLFQWFIQGRTSNASQSQEVAIQ